MGDAERRLRVVRAGRLHAESRDFAERLANVQIAALIEGRCSGDHGRIQAIEVRARNARTDDDDFLEFLAACGRFGLVLHLRYIRNFSDAIPTIGEKRGIHGP
ncbi:MAG: hypothetical protein ACYDAH_13015 [Steroidobacteraceae bacterium]